MGGMMKGEGRGMGEGRRRSGYSGSQNPASSGCQRQTLVPSGMRSQEKQKSHPADGGQSADVTHVKPPFM